MLMFYRIETKCLIIKNMFIFNLSYASITNNFSSNINCKCTAMTRKSVFGFVKAHI